VVGSNSNSRTGLRELVKRAPLTTYFFNKREVSLRIAAFLTLLLLKWKRKNLEKTTANLKRALSVFLNEANALV
jgi:hypothetical protein